MSKSKQRGTTFETAVVNYLNNHGVKCERRALSGKNDKGDVAGIGHSILELKATKSYDLASMMNEARVERDNAQEHFAFGVQKRFRSSIDRSYVVLELREAVAIFKILGDINVERLETYQSNKKLTKGAQ